MVNPIDQAVQDFLPTGQDSLEIYLTTLKQNIIKRQQYGEVIDQSLITLIKGAWLLKQTNAEPNELISEIKDFIKNTFNELDEPTQQGIKNYVNRFKGQYNFDNDNGDNASSTPGLSK